MDVLYRVGIGIGHLTELELPGGSVNFILHGLQYPQGSQGEDVSRNSGSAVVCHKAVNELHSIKTVMLCNFVTALTQEPRMSPATEMKRLTDILSTANTRWCQVTATTTSPRTHWLCETRNDQVESAHYNKLRWHILLAWEESRICHS